VQVHSVKPRLKAPGCERLKLTLDALLSNVDFNFNLRRFNKAEKDTLAAFDGKADKEEKEFVNAEEAGACTRSR